MNAPIRLYMTMSLDGFIAGPDDRPGQELQALLRAGLLDEMEIHLVPVLLGDGRPLFSAVDRSELELVRVLDAPGVTHL